MDPKEYSDLNPTVRTLLGPGPSDVPARVLQALAMPTIGHLDPYFQVVMDDVKSLLRTIFRTENEFSIPVSGTGSAGMEAALCNLIEPGDPVLIAVKGYFGERMYDMACRYSDQVDRIDRPWGEAFEPEEIRDAVRKKPYVITGIVHCETSTGVLQPNIQAISDEVHAEGGLLVLDTVASWPGVPVEVDAWGVDVVYSGSQKCLSAPPGLAPISLNTEARKRVNHRKTKVANWYLDLTALETYWGSGQRVYHHTAPVNMIYSLREALRLVAEEGLDVFHTRHQEVAQGLWKGLEDAGLPPSVPLPIRSPTLTTPTLPPGIDDLGVRRSLLSDFNIEIAGGFGPLAGKIWRIGLMGHSARREKVTLLLAALEEILKP